MKHQSRPFHIPRTELLPAPDKKTVKPNLFIFISNRSQVIKYNSPPNRKVTQLAIYGEMLALIRGTTTQNAINRMTFRVPTQESNYPKHWKNKNQITDKIGIYIYPHRSECTAGILRQTIHACLNSFAFDFRNIALLFVSSARLPRRHIKKTNLGNYTQQ